MEPQLRIILEPVTPELATMLLEDPVQLEEALCVAYDAPPIQGNWANELQSRRDRPEINSVPPTLWLVRIRSEDTIIGWVTTESTSPEPRHQPDSKISQAAENTYNIHNAHILFELNPAYQDVGYESEITRLVNELSGTKMSDPPKE